MSYCASESTVYQIARNITSSISAVGDLVQRLHELENACRREAALYGYDCYLEDLTYEGPNTAKAVLEFECEHPSGGIECHAKYDVHAYLVNLEDFRCYKLTPSWP